MQSNFTNYDVFGKYVEKQDQWIYDIRWSLPENKISAYRLEQFDKYAAEKQVEHVVMFSFEGLTNSLMCFTIKAIILAKYGQDM